MKIKFIKSPTGLFKLSYNAGDIGDIDKKLAEECISAGYAEAVIVKKVTTKQTTKKTK